MDQSDAIERRLVIVEGIVGSGKSTTIRFIATSLEKANRRARPIPEATMPHPTRAFGELAHPYQYRAMRPSSPPNPRRRLYGTGE